MWILLCNFIFFIGLGTSWSPYGNLGYLVRWSFKPRVGKACNCPAAFAFSPQQKATDWIQMSHGLDGFIDCYQRSVWRSHCDRREMLGLAVLQSQPLFCNYNFVPVQNECFINLLKQIRSALRHQQPCIKCPWKAKILI